MIPGLCTDLLTAEGIPRKPSMETVASNGVPYLKMTSARSHSTSGSKKGEKKENEFA